MRLSRSYERELAALALPRPRCAACDEPVAASVAFCAACASTAQRRAATDFRGEAATDAFAPFVYGGSIAHAIMRMKYEPRPDLARPLGDLLWASIEPYCTAWKTVVVVPVPLHPARLAERGFNQAALIAHCVARRLHAPLALALARTRDTPRQTTLDRQRRVRNMTGAFVVLHARIVANQTVLLVDDVRTTGATLAACAEALLRAGAARVRAVAVAQAELS